MVLFLLSSRAPVTKDPERDRERPWVLRPMAFLFDRSHGHHFHGFSCFLPLELSEGGDIAFLGKGVSIEVVWPIYFGNHYPQWYDARRRYGDEREIIRCFGGDTGF